MLLRKNTGLNTILWPKLFDHYRPNQKHKRVNVDFPIWMVASLDKEARHLGVTRQSIIKVWLAERLEKTASNNK